VEATLQGNVEAIGEERDEDVRLDPVLSVMEDWADGEAFAKPSANGRCFSTADGRSRRLAAIRDRDRERRRWEGKRS